MIAPETMTILSQIIGRDLNEQDAQNLFAELNRLESFSPNGVVSGLIEMLQLNYNVLTSNEQIEPIFLDILARDRHTGYYIHSALRAIYLDFALTRAAIPEQEERNFLLLGDFMNLSNVNDAIGRSTTNDVMATICGIYLHSMTRAGVVNWMYHRSMGDEITFVIIDTDKEKVEDGLREAESITDEFTQSLGLERLRHKKYPMQHGTGLVTAYVPLSGATQHREMKLQLEETIKEKKRTIRKRNTKFGWFGLQRAGVEPDQFHNRSSEQRIDKALHKYQYFRTMAQMHNETVSKTGLNRNAMNPAKTLVAGRAIAWPRDDRIEYLRNHHNNTKIMLRADIYNLGGLNTVFGHDGADHIKAHLIRILYTTITGHGYDEPKIFDCGGGIIDVVIGTLSDIHLHRLVETLQNNIHHQILSHSVAGYSNAHGLTYSGHDNIMLGNLPHPKMEAEGTGLVMATHAVESSRSLPEIIERLDKITNRTKMHNFAYLWEEENSNVFALSLNQSADSFLIGKDRVDPSPHYLPFTDALRRYMKTEDLPLIFERPVGQISETLFGTDMQAVLGFKKAIRLLQDKNISDAEIEKIDSYQMMDERLRHEGLPPLSVVSTQNRPSFVSNEPAQFRTMALAEKLENLPPEMTSLILQAQASFRTLKIVQPHGHLVSTQAVQVLEEELSRFRMPVANADHLDEQVTESLYALARLGDFTCAVLDKNMPIAMRQTLADISYEILRELSSSFEAVDEKFLAGKFHLYLMKAHPHRISLIEAIKTLEADVHQLVYLIQKKKPLAVEYVEMMPGIFEGLLGFIRNYAIQKTSNNQSSDYSNDS